MAAVDQPHKSSAADALKHLGARIRQSHDDQIVAVNLDATNVTDVDLARLEGLSNLQRLQLENRKAVSGSDFANGVHLRAGERFTTLAGES